MTSFIKIELKYYKFGIFILYSKQQNEQKLRKSIYQKERLKKMDVIF